MKNVTAVLITRHAEYPKEINLDGFGEVLIRTESPSVFERYLLADKAKCDVIYFQDDDCIVDYKSLYSLYDGRLTNYMTEHHQSVYKSKGATLVGWGCFFPKTMLASFSKYIDKYGVDAHLLREADRIFTVLNQPFNTIIGTHQDLTSASDGSRMWQESNHWTSMDEAIAKTKTLL
jgi:hypothetical protein